MSESPREKKILDELANGQTVHVGATNFGPLTQASMIAFNQIRSLLPRNLNLPLEERRFCK